MKEFIDKSPLDDWQKEEILSSAQKSKAYQTAISWYWLGRANSAQGTYDDYFQKNGIFIPLPLKEQFNKLSTMVYEALSEWRFNAQHESFPREMKKIEAFHAEGGQLLNALERDIQQRLWISTADSRQ